MSGSLKRKNTSGGSGQAKRPRVDPGESRSVSRNGAPPMNTESVVTPGQQEDGRSKSRPRSKRKGKQTATVETNATQDSKAVTSTTRNSSSRKETIHKLAPPRPFPTVPSSVSASGPKSAHKEGKNLICITRHTPLAAYLSRCKKLLVDDGYQILHLHAMGAAIPHLLTLSVSLPLILPFPRGEIKVEVRTGTIGVMDEVIPEDEDEDITLRARDKGGVSVMIQIRDGKECISAVAAKNTLPFKPAEGKGKKPAILIIQEQDQEDDEMDQDVDEVEADD